MGLEEGADAFQIIPANFSDSQVLALLQKHQAFCTAEDANITGAKTYALDLNALQKPNIQVWIVWESESSQVLGCGALKALSDGASGEIKAMHTLPAARGKGIGALVLEKLISEAKIRGFSKVYLETGALEQFAPARKFYEGAGFRLCSAYEGHSGQENSVYMNRDI